MASVRREVQQLGRSLNIDMEVAAQLAPLPQLRMGLSAQVHAVDQKISGLQKISENPESGRRVGVGVCLCCAAGRNGAPGG